MPNCYPDVPSAPVLKEDLLEYQRRGLTYEEMVDRIYISRGIKIS